MELQEAATLKYGEWLHHKTETQNGGLSCYRIRVNGAPKAFKRDINAIRVPVRWGARAGDQFSLDAHDLIYHFEREANCTNPVH